MSKHPSSATVAQVFSKADWYDIFLMLVGTIAAIGSGVMVPVSNLLFGRIMDKLNSDPDTFQKAIDRLSIDFCIVGAISLVCGYCQIVFWTLAGERQAQKFREAYVNAIFSQDIGWFDTANTSSLYIKVTEAASTIQDGIGRKLGDLIYNTVQFIAVICISFYLSWKLSLVLLVSIPFIFGAGYFLVCSVAAAQQQSFQQYSSAGGLANQMISVIHTVTALNMQPSILMKYREFLYDAMIVGIRKVVNVGLGNGAIHSVLLLSNGLCYWYGGDLVASAVENSCFSESCVSGGDVMTVFFCLVMGAIMLGHAASPLESFTAARIATAQILQTMDQSPRIDNLSVTGLKPSQECRGEIQLLDIEFSYPSRPTIKVCHKINLIISPGSTVAFVGSSGCGKSTIFNLLLRFYDPSTGCIKLDGYNTKDLNIHWLRSQIGYVGQQPVLFPGTIAENIMLGMMDEISQESLSSCDTDYSTINSLSKVVLSHFSKQELMDRVVDAAMKANAHNFIMGLPKQYDTNIGSNGMLLSGGQKQRLAIARALIKRPSVLLLDEATSALDAASERIVQESIDLLASAKSQTILIIAHRLSTIKHADKIVVIHEGCIAETGNHEELLSQNGRYAELIRLQLSANEFLEYSSPKANLVRSIDKNQEENFVVPSNTTKDHERIASTETKNSTTIEDSATLTKERRQTLIRRIWGLIFRYPVWFVWGFLGALIFGAITPLWGYLMAKSQELFYQPDPDEIRSEASRFGLFYILFAVVALVTSVSQYAGLLGMGEKIAIYLRSEMFEALLHREIAFFDEVTNDVATLTTILAEDCRLVNAAFSESFARQMQALCNIVVSLALSLSASWKITLVILATFPLVIGTSIIQMKVMTATQYEDMSEETEPTIMDCGVSPPSKKSLSDSMEEIRNSDTSSEENHVQLEGKNNDLLLISNNPEKILATAFAHIRTISALSMQRRLMEQYNYLTRIRSESRIHHSHWVGIGFGGSNAIRFWVYGLLFWYGAILMCTENLSFVDCLIAIFALMFGVLGLGATLSDMGDQKAALLAADRIFRCIDEAKESKIDGLSNAGIVPSYATNDISLGQKMTLEPTKIFGSKIEFRNVSFHYPNRAEIEVCRKHNFIIQAGETVAFVGPSGSGKSTIINLLLRFYDPTEGSVLFDDINLCDLNVRYVRSQCGYVGQDAAMFPGSVLENIVLGRASHRQDPLMSLDACIEELESTSTYKHATWKALIPFWPLSSNFTDVDCTSSSFMSHPTSNNQKHYQPIEEVSSMDKDCIDNNIIEEDDVTVDVETGHVQLQLRSSQEDTVSYELPDSVPEDVINACRLAHAHDFIMSFPDQYMTKVGDNSLLISGGQKQRLAIARALIKQPRILLLDEATSALDAQSEHFVQESIDALTAQDVSRRPTTIVIAHRLSSVCHADRIFVIDHGDIVECGTHEELLRSSAVGLYREMWVKQQNGYVSASS